MKTTKNLDKVTFLNQIKGMIDSFPLFLAIQIYLTKYINSLQNL